MAARRGGFVPCEINAVACPTAPNRPFEFIGDYCDLSNRSATAEVENPGALAGATGAICIEQVFKTKHYRNRAEAATALCHAIAECDPDDASQIMAVALADLSAGQPVAPLFSFMDQAAFWADFALVPELKAYALACYSRLPAKDQAAFLAYIGGRAAA